MKNQKTLRRVVVLASIRRSAGDACRTAMNCTVRRLFLNSFLSIMAAGLLSAPADADANAALEWNAIATEAFLPTQGTDPLSQSRAYAMLHAAIHDALNAIRSAVRVLHAGHDRDAGCLAGCRGGRCRARRAGRAHPDAARSSTTRMRLRWPRFPTGRQRQRRCRRGRRRRYSILERRADDGVAEAFATPYVPTGVPGDYTFTPPFDVPPLGPLPSHRDGARSLPLASTFARHRLSGPLPIRSAAYAADFAYVKAIGEVEQHGSHRGAVARSPGSGTRTRQSAGIESPTPCFARNTSDSGSRRASLP